jgi:hypothetical protein
MPPAESPSAEEALIRLGERILQELGADRTNDTLTRWLAHHTAELIGAADKAAAAGEPDAHTRAAEAQAAILQLWEHRSAWPHGWPPPRAARIVRLLNNLPTLDGPQWHRGNVLARLHDLHHQILGAVVDLATADVESTEGEWLAESGLQLSADELTLLTHAARVNDRVRRLMDSLEGIELGDSDADHEGSPQSHPLAGLADVYRETVLEYLQRAVQEDMSNGEHET